MTIKEYSRCASIVIGGHERKSNAQMMMVRKWGTTSLEWNPLQLIVLRTEATPELLDSMLHLAILLNDPPKFSTIIRRICLIDNTGYGECHAELKPGIVEIHNDLWVCQQECRTAVFFNSGRQMQHTLNMQLLLRLSATPKEHGHQ